MADYEGINLGNGYFLNLEKPKLDLSSCPANFTRIIEREGNGGMSAGWIVFLVLGILVLLFGMVILCVESADKDRRSLIRELRNTPSYNLHKKLEKLYEREIGIQTERLRYVERYPKVSFQVDEENGERTITVVENLDWVRQISRDAVREKERVGLENNEDTSEDRHQMQELRSEENEAREALLSEQEQAEQPPPYIAGEVETPADRNVNP